MKNRGGKEGGGTVLVGVSTVRGHKLDHLAINSTTAMAGNVGCTLASLATAVVEFMAKRLNLYPRTVSTFTRLLWEAFPDLGFLGFPKKQIRI